MKFLAIIVVLINLAIALAHFCGLANEDQLDLNGCQQISPNQFPWHVGLVYLDFYYCGGSIISNINISKNIF